MPRLPKSQFLPRSDLSAVAQRAKAEATKQSNGLLIGEDRESSAPAQNVANDPTTDTRHVTAGLARLSCGDIGVRAGRPNRLTGTDRGRSPPCARDISPISSGGWSVNPVPYPVEEYAPNIVTRRRWRLAGLNAGQDA
jgi:hypothetical protein